MFVNEALGVVQASNMAVDVKLPVLDDGFVDRQHDLPLAQGAANRSKTGCRDFLENGHHKAEGSTFVTLPLGKVEAVKQVLSKLVVEPPLGFRHGERFGVYESPGEQRRSAWGARIRLGSPEDYRVQAVTLLNHLIGATEQGWVQELDEHPEPKMVALVRRSGKQKKVAAVVPQRLSQFVVLGARDFASVAIGGEMVRLVEDHKVPRRGVLEPPDAGGPFQRVDAGD